MSIEQQQHIMEICWCGAVILLLLCWTFRRTDAAVVLLIIEHARTIRTNPYIKMKMYINEFVTVIIFFFSRKPAVLLMFYLHYTFLIICNW